MRTAEKLLTYLQRGVDLSCSALSKNWSISLRSCPVNCKRSEGHWINIVNMSKFPTFVKYTGVFDKYDKCMICKMPWQRVCLYIIHTANQTIIERGFISFFTPSQLSVIKNMFLTRIMNIPSKNCLRCKKAEPAACMTCRPQRAELAPSADDQQSLVALSL